MVFSISAVSVQCGNKTPKTTTTLKTTNKKSDEETTAPETTATAKKGSNKKSSETTSAETKSSTTASETATTAVAPTIKLEIYEGPTYSAADNVCYYRIKATVTGSPSPSVAFSRDDSNGAFGKDKGQVNLTKASPNYTLTATAKNSAGQASASITLNWGCDTTATQATVPIVTLPNLEIHINLNQVNSEGGFILQGFPPNPNITDEIFVGDYTNNKPYRGFASYDITSLKGAAIKDATLTLNLDIKQGDTSGLGDLWVAAVDYGANPLVTSDFDLTGIPIQSFPANGSGNITCNNSTLVTQLQNAINAGKERFQIRIHFSVPTNGNNLEDFWMYLKSGVTLSVNYT